VELFSDIFFDRCLVSTGGRGYNGFKSYHRAGPVRSPAARRRKHMYSIGIFTTERSLRHIMRIDQEMRSQSNITYLPYSSPEHLKYLYEQNRDRFDAFLFTGSYPYNVLRREFGALDRPHAHCNVSDRDYYKLIAQLAIQQPELDFSRVYFDRPEIPVDFYTIFQKEGFPLLGTASIDWNRVAATDWYAPLKDYYLELWNSGKVELLVTRFGSMDDYFHQHQIKFRYLAPSPESMLETFHGLLMQLQAGEMHDSAACLALIRSPQATTEEQQTALGVQLQSCNKQLGMPFLIYEHGDHYELTTNTSVLKDLSQQYTTCPVTAFLDSRLDFTVCAGWGCSSNVINAHRNAQRAVKEALLCKGSAAFIVMDDNKIIGPLSSPRRITYSDAPSQPLTQLAGRLSVSPLYLSKIASVLAQRGEDTLSAEELAYFLNVTSRSASRILSKLEAGGLACVQYHRQMNLRGRPAKIYKISLEDIPLG